MKETGLKVAIPLKLLVCWILDAKVFLDTVAMPLLGASKSDVEVLA
jgi:hypothetical protein